MKSFFIIAALLSLALLAGTINARKEPEFKARANVRVSNDESMLQEFKIKPGLWEYGNAEDILGKERKSSLWTYNDEKSEPSKNKLSLKKNKSSFWVYGEDDDMLAKERKSSLWNYSDEKGEPSKDKLILKKGKSSFWVYGEDDKQKDDSLLANERESSLMIYNDQD